MRGAGRVLVALWTGAVACVGFLVAPLAFSELGRDEAARLLPLVFRVVDLFGAGAALLALLALPRGRRRSAVVLGSMGVAAVVNAAVLGPLIAARREPFAFYHGASTALWVGILLCGAVLLWLDAWRR